MPQEGDHQEKISANPRTNPIVTPTLQHSLVPGLTKIKADRIQLQQVVLNLMMNGMGAVAETTERPRELLISAREKDSELIVRVEDSGMGLDAEIVQKIFNPFFTTKPHGFGMGLSISRSIIESRGGHLWAVPRPSGGTIFQFTQPIRPKESDA